VSTGLGENASVGSREGEVAAGLGVNADAGAWEGETSGGEGVGDAIVRYKNFQTQIFKN